MTPERSEAYWLGYVMTMEVLMPPVSQQQRKLMWAAASKRGGVGGVSQSVGKEFAEADPGGKLPKRTKAKKRRTK